MADVVEIWADTGAVIERDFTAEEAAQRAADLAAAETAAAEAAAAEAARLAAVESGLAKLRALGLTDDEIGALMGAVS